MLSQSQISTIQFIISFVSIDARLVTSLDDMALVTNPEYLISNWTIHYLEKSHYKYFIDMIHNVMQKISDYWVSICNF